MSHTARTDSSVRRVGLDLVATADEQTARNREFKLLVDSLSIRISFRELDR